MLLYHRMLLLLLCYLDRRNIFYIFNCTFQMKRYSPITFVLLALIMPKVVFAQEQQPKNDNQIMMSGAVQWDRYIDSAIYDGYSPVIRHVILFNPSSSNPTLVKRVYLIGRDVAEFSILNTEAPSLSSFILQSGDLDWFDIAFTPEISKPTG